MANYKDISEKELQSLLRGIKRNRRERINALKDLVFVSHFRNPVTKTGILIKLENFRKDYTETTWEGLSSLDSILLGYESEFCIYESA